MQELVDIGQFEKALTALCVALTLVAGIAGAVLVKRGRMALGQAVALAALGPLLYGAWRYYAWTVRYDPLTGYCGLHKVSVLLLNVGAFSVLGVVGGLVARRLGRQRG